MDQQSIITCCPGCDTRFRVTSQQLRSAGGKVRCGTCLAVFDALECRQSPERSGNADNTPKGRDRLDNQPSLHDGDPVRQKPPTPTPPKTPEIIPQREQPLRASALPHSADHLSPLPTEVTAPKSGLSLTAGEDEVTHTFLWSLASLLAILTLAAQLLWFERDRLAWHPSFTGIYQMACTRLECNLPPRQQLDAIRSESLEIKPHPQYKNTLSLELSLHNGATFSQPFPALDLSFSDLKGREVARRRFQPQDYLPLQAGTRGYMSADGRHLIRLEILNPSARAINYEIALVAPNY